MYADVAQMIGKYVLRDTNTGPGGEAVVPEVAEMRIQSALVANDVNAKQVLRTTAKFNEAKTSLSCSFSSVDVSDAFALFIYAQPRPVCTYTHVVPLQEQNIPTQLTIVYRATARLWNNTPTASSASSTSTPSAPALGRGPTMPRPA